MQQERMLPIEEIFNDFLNFEVFLPFFMIFLIGYVVLQNFFSKNKNINALIAIILALFFINNDNLVSLFNKFLPNISSMVISVIALLLGLGLIFGKNLYKSWIIWLGIIIAGYSIGISLEGFTPDDFSDFIREWINLILFIIVAIIIFYFTVVREKPKKRERPRE